MNKLKRFQNNKCYSVLRNLDLINFCVRLNFIQFQKSLAILKWCMALNLKIVTFYWKFRIIKCYTSPNCEACLAALFSVREMPAFQRFFLYSRIRFAAVLFSVSKRQKLLEQACFSERAPRKFHKIDCILSVFITKFLTLHTNSKLRRNFTIINFM